MPSYFRLRVVLVLCLGLAGAGGAFAQSTALPHATAKKFAPFDLKYVMVEPQGIVGIRPAEIVKLMPGKQMPAEYQAVLQMCANMFMTQCFDCKFNAADMPAFADIDQCVCRISATATMPHEDKQGTFIGGLGTPFTVQTVKPFDWAGLVQKWFPKAQKRQHAGQDYVRVKWTNQALLQFASKNLQHQGNVYAAIYVADDRTVVVADESNIRRLLDRLQAGKSAPMPPGWKEFECDLIAMALNTRETPFLKGGWSERPDYNGPDETCVRTLIEGTQVLAAGINIGERSEFRLTARASNAATARKMATAARHLLNVARQEASAKAKDPEMKEFLKQVRTTLQNITISRDGRSLHLQTGIDANVLDLLATLLQNDATPTPSIEESGHFTPTNDVPVLPALPGPTNGLASPGLRP